jgi:hypothetical protein
MGCRPGAIFGLKKKSAQRPVGWTSADAGGLPPHGWAGRYDEIVQQRKPPCVLRLYAKQTQRAFVFPASHFASNGRDSSLRPMGVRFRLKADHDISRFPPTARVIFRGPKSSGMILGDNGEIGTSSAPPIHVGMTRSWLY